MKIKIASLFFASILVLTLPTIAVAEVIKVTVNGMVCAFCAQGIKKNFLKVPGVTEVKPNLENKLVTIITKEDAVLTDTTIGNVIKDAGYDLKEIVRSKNE